MLLALSFSFGPAVKAQETKTVNRVKIVTVDEKGEKVVIDTTVADLKDLKGIGLGEGKSWTFISDEGKTIIATDKDGKNLSWTIVKSEGDSIGGKHGVKIVSGKDIHFYIDEDTDIDHEGAAFVKTMKKDGSRMIIKVDEDGNEAVWHLPDNDEIEGDEKHIIIKSADGEDVFKIKGDAVITIKDGKIDVVSGEGDKKEVIKETEKTVKKKKN